MRVNVPTYLPKNITTRASPGSNIMKPAQRKSEQIKTKPAHTPNCQETLVMAKTNKTVAQMISARLKNNIENPLSVVPL